MTMPQGSTEEPSVTLTGQPSIPVHVVSSYAKPGKSIGTEFGRWRTFLVTSTVGNDSATPGARRLLNRSLRRHRAHIIVNAALASSTPFGGVTQTAYGSITDPGAFDGFVFTPSLTAGTYVLTVTAFFSGTVEAADAANMEVTGSGITGMRIPVPPVANVPVTVSQTVTLAAAAAVGVQSITAGSNAAVVYNANISAQPVASGGNSSLDGVIIGGREEIASGNAMTPGQVGGYLQIGDNIRWEVQQELWVAYPVTNSGPVFVSVCDEVYASDPDSFLGDETSS
jgi:hypothetical protein